MVLSKKSEQNFETIDFVQKLSALNYLRNLTFYSLQRSLISAYSLEP